MILVHVRVELGLALGAGSADYKQYLQEQKTQLKLTCRSAHAKSNVPILLLIIIIALPLCPRPRHPPPLIPLHASKQLAWPSSSHILSAARLGQIRRAMPVHVPMVAAPEWCENCGSKMPSSPPPPPWPLQRRVRPLPSEHKKERDG